MTQRLTNSEHVFEKEYTDTQKRNLKTKIVVHIDHIGGTYKITPGVGTRGEFGFLGDSKNNHQLWTATAQLIQEAISFAEEVVNPVEDIAEIIEDIPTKTDDHKIIFTKPVTDSDFTQESMIIERT